MTSFGYVALAILNQQFGIWASTAANSPIRAQIAVRPRDLDASANVRNDLTSSAQRLAGSLRRRMPLFPNDLSQPNRRVGKELIESTAQFPDRYAYNG